MWKPRVLSEYEIARAVAAIEEIARRDKPIAEVGSRQVQKADLLHDLKACIRLAKAQGKVFFWIRKCGKKRLWYGFYSHRCMFDAWKHMIPSKIDPMLRHVFLGLLYGYRPGAIQEFIIKQKRMR